MSKENKTALTNIDNESKEITKILNNSPINELDLINKIYSINKNINLILNYRNTSNYTKGVNIIEKEKIYRENYTLSDELKKLLEKNSIDVEEWISTFKTDYNFGPWGFLEVLHYFENTINGIISRYQKLLNKLIGRLIINEGVKFTSNGSIKNNGIIINNGTIIHSRIDDKLGVIKGNSIKNFIIGVSSLFDNNELTITFRLNKKLKSNEEFKIKYAFIKNTKISTAYNIMSLPKWTKNNPPNNYQTLIFNKNTNEISKTFTVKNNLTTTEVLNLPIKIIEDNNFKGKLNKINDTNFNQSYIFTAKIQDTKNTSIGNDSFKLKSGKNNTSVGSKSMEITTKDSKVNTALGYQALNNVTNLRNIGIGVNAGKNTKNGSNNILIGVNSKTSNTNSKNQIVIGNDAKVDDNSILINQKNILPGKKDSNLGHKDYKFDKLYSEKIVNGDLKLTLPKNEKKLSGDRYLEVDDKGIIKLVSLKNILSNL